MRLETFSSPDMRGDGWIGAILCHDLVDHQGHPVLLKGRRLEAEDAATLARARLRELHLLWPEPGDVDEDAAALRLAKAVAGPGVSLHAPVASQVRLSSAQRGLVGVNAAALSQINRIEGITVFTVPDGMPVERGQTVAGVKITPLVIPEQTLAEAERLSLEAAHSARTVMVRGFSPLRVAAVVREAIGDRALLQFETSLKQRAAWFGGSVQAIDHALQRREAREAVLRAVREADLVLVAGVASVDPLEDTWRDLLEVGASVVRRGLPVHPGSSYWLARLGDVPVVGVASCGMLSRRSALDLLLTRCFAGEALDPEFLAGLGHGGLLGPWEGWRIPRYAGTTEAR